MAPYILRVGAVVLCLAATWIIGLFGYGVLFEGFPFRRAAPFFLIALLFYFGAWAQLALVRLGQHLKRS